MRYAVIGYEPESIRRGHHEVFATFSTATNAIAFCKHFYGQYVLDRLAGRVLYNWR